MLIQVPALQNRQWWSVELMSRWLHFLSSWSCEYAYTGRFLCPHVLCPNEIHCRKVYNRLVLGSPRCFFWVWEKLWKSDSCRCLFQKSPLYGSGFLLMHLFAEGWNGWWRIVVKQHPSCSLFSSQCSHELQLKRLQISQFFFWLSLTKGMMKYPPWN